MTTRTIWTGALTVALLLVAAPAYAEDAVPDVVGLRTDKAQALIQDAGYVCNVSYDASRPAGLVFDQTPGGFANRAKGTNVAITVGGTAPVNTPTPGPADDGPPTGALPDMPGPDMPGPAPVDTPDPLPDDPGMPPTGDMPTVDREPDAPAAPGVLGLPAARLPSKNGPQVPSVLGERRNVAYATLGTWQVVEEQSLGLPDLVGKVINQRPTPGNTLAAGETVVIVIAVAESPSGEHRFVPNFRGKSIQDVRWALEANGFRADLYTVPSSAADFGRAVSQRPGPGALLMRGDAVIVHIGRGADAATQPDPVPDTPSIDPIPDTPEPAPVDTPGPDDPGAPPTGNLPPVPGPSDPVPDTPEPAPVDTPEPAPVDTPEPGPVDTPEPPPAEPEPPKVVLPKPTLRSPPKGESYPRAYGATFEWSPVGRASSYQWELQEEQPSGAWQTISDETIESGTSHRPDRMKRGRYRWHVRAKHGETPGEWSDWFRLYMY